MKQTIGQLRTTITTLQKGQTKQDELELKLMTSTNENTKLQRQLDTLNRFTPPLPHPLETSA